MIGAVLNTINTRLDPNSISFILAHGEAKVLIYDIEFTEIVKQALHSLEKKPILIR